MTFKESVRTCLKEKYATFSGRASRSEYWYFSLFYFLLVVAGGLIIGTLTALAGVSSQDGISGAPLFALIPLGIIGVLLILPTLSVFIRRLHDKNISGWWYLALFVVSLIPVPAIQIITGIGGIVFFVILFLKGTNGPNKFGDDPLGNNSTDVFK